MTKTKSLALRQDYSKIYRVAQMHIWILERFNKMFPSSFSLNTKYIQRKLLEVQLAWKSHLLTWKQFLESSTSVPVRYGFSVVGGSSLYRAQTFLFSKLVPARFGGGGSVYFLTCLVSCSTNVLYLTSTSNSTGRWKPKICSLFSLKIKANRSIQLIRFIIVQSYSNICFLINYFIYFYVR